MILSKKKFPKHHQNKVILVLKLLNSRTWMTSVVIFQALETFVTSLTLEAPVTSLASTASTALFPQKTPDPDGLIITGTKMTNVGHFLWNGSSKTQLFTNIWYPDGFSDFDLETI